MQLMVRYAPQNVQMSMYSTFERHLKISCRSSNGPEFQFFLLLLHGARAVSDTALDLVAASGVYSVAPV